MHRTKTLGALAIAAAASSALLAFPTSATATTSTSTIACDKATVEFRTFGPPPQALAHYDLLVDGIPFTSPGPILRNGVPVSVAPGTLTPAGPLTVFEIPLNLRGVHVVSIDVRGTASNAFSEATARVDCPVPEPPLVTPPPPKPPEIVPPEPPVRIVTCADLRRVGAGRKWLVKHNCIRKVPPPPLTCADLRARGAGLRSLIARGCTPPLRPPFEPPFLG